MVVKINFHGGRNSFHSCKNQCLGGKNQFEEDHAVLQAAPSSLKLPIDQAICDGRVTLE